MREGLSRGSSAGVFGRSQTYAGDKSPQSSGLPLHLAILIIVRSLVASVSFTHCAAVSTLVYWHPISHLIPTHTSTWRRRHLLISSL